MEILERDIETSPITEKKEILQDDVLVIVLLCKNANFKGTLKPYDIEMFGKKMWEWVVLSADDHKVKTVTCTEESDILALIKPLLTNTKYTMVLYSDTPLMTKNTIKDILTFVRGRQTNVLKLSRGYVFDTEYIRNAESILATQTEFFNEEDFLTIYDFKQLAFANDIMKHRILEFHLSNGVQIDDMNTTFIDADVVIESGTRIMPNNVIKGISYIDKNCLLKPNNVIENSIISANVEILQSYICESKISQNSIVGPFEKIKEKNI